MGVIKKSSSGKALQVILSEDLPAGTILQCALSPVLKLSDNGFVVLTILPMGTSGNRFPKSKVYGQTGDTVIPSGLKGDSLSRKGASNLKKQKVFSSKVVNL